MEIVKVNGTEKLILEKDKDVCPVCETKIKDIYWSWNTFHGEASASCCGSPYQLKSWYVEDDEDLKKFSDSLDRDGFYYFPYSPKITKILRDFIKIHGKKSAHDEQYLKKIRNIINSTDDATTWTEYFKNNNTQSSPK